MNIQRLIDNPYKDLILQLFFRNKKKFINNLIKYKENYLNEYFKEHIRLLIKDDNEEKSAKRKEFSMVDFNLFENIYCVSITIPLCFLNKITNSKYYMFFYQKSIFGINNCWAVALQSFSDDTSAYSVYYTEEIYGQSDMFSTNVDGLMVYLYNNRSGFINNHEINDIKTFL